MALILTAEWSSLQTSVMSSDRLRVPPKNEKGSVYVLKVVLAALIFPFRTCRCHSATVTPVGSQTCYETSEGGKTDNECVPSNL